MRIVIGLFVQLIVGILIDNFLTLADVINLVNTVGEIMVVSTFK